MDFPDPAYGHVHMEWADKAQKEREAEEAQKEQDKEDCIEGETEPYAIDNADFNVTDEFRIRYGGVPPNVFVDKCALSPSADAIKSIQVDQGFAYDDVKFAGVGSMPLFKTFTEYCEAYERFKGACEGQIHHMPYPDTFPGRTHQHEVNEPEILWTSFLQLRSGLMNTTPPAIEHFNPPTNHPSHLTYRTNQPDGVDWRPMLAQFYCHFHYALRISRIKPYDHQGWSHHVGGNGGSCWDKTYGWEGIPSGYVALLPHICNNKYDNCSPEVPDTKIWRSMSDVYFGKSGAQVRRNFIKHNRKAVAEHNDVDLWVLRAKVGYRIAYEHHRKDNSRGYKVADRYAEILQEEIDHNEGELTVGMVFDAADDATLEMNSHPYDTWAEYEPDDRYDHANQAVKDPVNPWEKR